MTVAELDSRMSAGELVEWKAYAVYAKAMAEMERKGGGPVGR